MMLKKHSTTFIFLLITLSLVGIIRSFMGFKPEEDISDDEIILNHQIDFDLDKIKERGKLKVLTENSSTSYFIYRGTPMGFEYELLKDFAKYLGVDLEVHVAQNMDNIFKQLARGEIDIVAANLTITKERNEKLGFSIPIMQTRQVLIQRKYSLNNEEDDYYETLEDVTQLVGKKVHVRKGSSFYNRLLNLKNEISGDFEIVEVDGNIDTEKLIFMVANGEIDYTVADENVGKINQTYYNNIDISVPISLSQNIGWAVRKNAVELEKEINLWLAKTLNTNRFAAYQRKYFVTSKSLKYRNVSDYFSKSGNRISEYDELIMKYSEQIDWDWKLLAAMIYQESKFNHDAVSWAGASGLMQIMPKTAEALGLDTLNEISVEDNIKTGVKYIKRMNKYWSEFIDDENERIKFILASYNVGLGHVKDAQRLATKYGKDDLIWDNNVAEYLLKKSESKYYLDPVVKHGYCRGREPYKYVNEILSRYRDYLNIFGAEESLVSKR